MSLVLTKVTQFLNDDDGPTAVEYAVMLGLIIVICVTAISTLGNSVSNAFSNTTTTWKKTAS